MGHLISSSIDIQIWYLHCRAKEDEEVKKLIEDAKFGGGRCFASIRKIPKDLAKVSESVNIPTIGIGASRYRRTGIGAS